MQLNPSASLSWQTGILKFRNQSLPEIKQLLESHYETKVQLFQDKSSNYQPESPSKSEINLVLFIYYDLELNQLMIRGVCQ